MEEVIHVSQENSEVVDNPEYSDDIFGFFSDIPSIARPLIQNAETVFSRIERMLYSAPAFINLIRSSIPEQAFQAVLTNEQKLQLASGSLKLMAKKDGKLMANLVNPDTNKIVSTISLENVNLSPALSQAMINFSTQMQMAQIAEQIQVVKVAVEEVRQGQEYDRLATAYSCQQKFLQAMEIRNPEIRSMALIKISHDAEDSRNLLMQSQNANLQFIKEQPESYFGKLLSTVSEKQINNRIHEIRENLNAVNMVSLTEALAYQEMGENDAAKRSLMYYAEYIQRTYLDVEGLVERLDQVDPSPEKYWSKILPTINRKIQTLSCIEKTKVLEEKQGEKKSL